MTAAPERYGRRKVSKMLAEWNAHRDAVASGDMVAVQDTFDACEEWIDFAFGRAPEVVALIEAARAEERERCAKAVNDLAITLEYYATEDGADDFTVKTGEVIAPALRKIAEVIRAGE